MSRMNRPPVSISKIARTLKDKKANKVVVTVGTVTDDIRLAEIPALKVCALKFSEKARARITAAGGQCLSFDQLALSSPKGSGCVLIRGPRFSRETCKHWGAPGVPGSHAKPYVGKAHMRGRKHERARGRRNSRAFKVKK